MKPRIRKQYGGWTITEGHTTWLALDLAGLWDIYKERR